MKKEAIFSDGTGNFISPAEPNAYETVTIRFRTAKNDVDFVNLVTESNVLLMGKINTKGEFDYYEIAYELKEEPLRYSFEVRGHDESCYYNRCGVCAERKREFDKT